MCTISNGTGCSAAGFQALATHTGSFGCAILSEWTPGITPLQWDLITNGVQLTVQNGDECPDGTNRGIQVQFTCDPAGGVGPKSFSASEPAGCQYEWQFATSGEYISHFAFMRSSAVARENAIFSHTELLLCHCVFLWFPPLLRSGVRCGASHPDADA
jgi:hypothetical protein